MNASQPQNTVDASAITALLNQAQVLKTQQESSIAPVLSGAQNSVPITSQSTTPTVPDQTQSYDPSSIQAYAQPLVQQAFPNDPNAWSAFDKIVKSESNWNPSAANKTSSARGLFQFLASTAPNYGLPADASTASVPDQVAAGIKYIQHRYGTPSNAESFHIANGWY